MAATVRAAIVKVLRDNAALIALLPDDEHVYHRSAPQDADYPFVILSKQSGSPEYTFADWHDNELWTVKGVARAGSAVEADDLDKAIKAALQDAELEIDGQATLLCRRDEDVNYGEIEEGTQVHHAGAMFRILHQHSP